MSEGVAPAGGPPPVVVMAVGNPSRGDDALGPELHRRLQDWLASEGLRQEVEAVEDFQLQIEHALDLRGRRLAIFIDAGENTPAPFVFTRIAPAAGLSHATHALSPQAVLRVYQQAEGEAPPPAYVLCVRGESFELGEPLGEAARRHADAAFALLQDVCRRPDPEYWQARAEAMSQPADAAGRPPA